VKARERERLEREAVRDYLTESVRLLPEGRAYTLSLRDLLAQGAQPQDTRSGDEIAVDVISSLGLEVTE
jgi:hypothetical protein